MEIILGEDKMIMSLTRTRTRTRTRIIINKKKKKKKRKYLSTIPKVVKHTQLRREFMLKSFLNFFCIHEIGLLGWWERWLDDR